MSYMRVGFMCEADDIQWLKDKHLAGVPLPSKWQGFQSFVLQGHEDMPRAVNLYLSDTPCFDDDYFRIVFKYDMVYCEGQEYNGATDQPK